MPRGKSPKTMDLINAALLVLERIEPTTVRGVCYQLFNRRVIPNMSKASTDRVSRALVYAREQGLLPWPWIVDDTRAVELPSTWDDPETFIDIVTDSYRRNRWANQPERVMVVSEKATVCGMVRPVIEAWGVPFAVYHGFSSATAVRNLARRSAADRRPLTIIYAGDHDPSGRYMSEKDLPERLDRYGGAARIERVAVTQKQIERHHLLTFPAEEKRRDARYAWFTETYGRVCCELDALDPNLLRRAVEEAILAHLDRDAWDRAGSTEEAEIASLRDFFQSWSGMA